MNLRDHEASVNKAANSGFENLRRHHQIPKTGMSVTLPKKHEILQNPRQIIINK